jgi:hypothetical protein
MIERFDNKDAAFMPEQTDHYRANFFFVHVYECTLSEAAVPTNGDNGEARERSRASLERGRES